MVFTSQDGENCAFTRTAWNLGLGWEQDSEMEPTQLSPGFSRESMLQPKSQCLGKEPWQKDRVLPKFVFRLYMQIRRYVRTTFVFARDSDDIFCCHSFNFCDRCLPIIKIFCHDDRLRWLVNICIYVLQVLIFEVFQLCYCWRREFAD